MDVVKKKRVSFRSKKDPNENNKHTSMSKIKKSDGFKSIIKKKNAFFIQAIYLDIDASLVEASLELVEDRIQAMRNACSAIDDNTTFKMENSFAFRYLESTYLNLKNKLHSLENLRNNKKQQLDDLKNDQRKLMLNLLKNMNEV